VECEHRCLEFVLSLHSGAGYERLDSTPTGSRNTDIGYNGGLGFRFFAGDNAGLRLEGRYVGINDGCKHSLDGRKISKVCSVCSSFSENMKQKRKTATTTVVSSILRTNAQCTPAGTKVGADGCEAAAPKDSDNDGVVDGKLINALEHLPTLKLMPKVALLQTMMTKTALQTLMTNVLKLQKTLLLIKQVAHWIQMLTTSKITWTNAQTHLQERKWMTWVAHCNLKHVAC
jgi:hypothetical protein